MASPRISARWSSMAVAFVGCGLLLLFIPIFSRGSWLRMRSIESPTHFIVFGLIGLIVLCALYSGSQAYTLGKWRLAALWGAADALFVIAAIVALRVFDHIVPDSLRLPLPKLVWILIGVCAICIGISDRIRVFNTPEAPLSNEEWVRRTHRILRASNLWSIEEATAQMECAREKLITENAESLGALYGTPQDYAASCTTPPVVSTSDPDFLISTPVSDTLTAKGQTSASGVASSGQVPSPGKNSQHPNSENRLPSAGTASLKPGKYIAISVISTLAAIWALYKMAIADVRISTAPLITLVIAVLINVSSVAVVIWIRNKNKEIPVEKIRRRFYD